MKYQEKLILLIIVLISLGLSAIHPFDMPTWVLEVFPVLVALPLLLLTYQRFPLTPLLYRLIFIHSLILILGGHYTYARVPAGDWVRQVFDLSRNHYDRLGHFAQGFIPAMVAREILLRTSPLRPGKWLFFLVVSVCLAFSAFYEFIEWWTAVILGQAAHDFLGTQGDPWDTQWDMFLAFTGAIIAQVLLAHRHDRELRALNQKTAA